jgi:hypothetical protein
MIDSPTDCIVPVRVQRSGIDIGLESGGGKGNSLCTLAGGVLGCVYVFGLSEVTSRASSVAGAIVRGVCGIEMPRADGLGVWLGERDGTEL